MRTARLPFNVLCAWSKKKKKGSFRACGSFFYPGNIADAGAFYPPGCADMSCSPDSTTVLPLPLRAAPKREYSVTPQRTRRAGVVELGCLLPQ